MRLSIVLFFLLSVLLSAQSRTLIYFKDKGAVSEKTFAKSTGAFTAALNSISPRSIERRKKDPTRPVVDYTDMPLNEEYVRELEALGYKVVYRLKWLNAVSVIAPAAGTNNLQSLPFVAAAEPVRSLSFREQVPVQFTQNAPAGTKAVPTSYGQSFLQMNLSEVPKLHKLGINGSGVLMGFLDSGFDWKNHEATKDRSVVAEYDFVFHDFNTANEPNDIAGQHDHGTYVFSLAAGYKDSLLIGPAYGARFLLAKTEDIRSETHIEEDNYAAALQWMDSIGVDITSSSLGYNIFDTGLSYKYSDMNGSTAICTKAAELAFSKGILTFSAAGNEGNGSWKYLVAPSDGVFTLAVGALTSEDSIASFSSLGPSYDGRVKPDIAVMGADCFGARAGTKSGYLWNSGTSAATPIASSISALILSVYPHLNNKQLRSIMHYAGNSYFRPNNYRGYGLVSAVRALEIPNLQSSNGKFILNKFFYDTLSVSSATAYIKHGSVTDTIAMTAAGNGKFAAQLNTYTSGMRFSVSFKATVTGGRTLTYPADGSMYSFSYGSLDLTREKEGATAAGSTNYEIELPAPNPFGVKTSFSVVAPRDGNVTIAVYSITGERVRTIYSGNLAKGQYTYTWNAKTNDGTSVADGVYIVSLESDSGITAKKVLHLKKSQ